MKNTPDEDGIWYIPLAILIAAVAIAAFLVPSAPAEAPEVEQAEPQSMFIHKVYADELEPQVVQIATTSPEQVEPAVPELHPELQVICSCESKGVPDGKPLHFEKDGVTVLTGRVDPRDRGMCQINSYYWGEKANDLGYDIETVSGNIKMANYIYKTQGVQPWSASKKCHGK